MGTDIGLIRYNGLETDFVLPADGRSLVVLKVFRDRQERIWVSTFHNGLFYVQGDSLIKPPVNRFLDEVRKIHPDMYIRDMAFTENRRLYFSYHAGGQVYYEVHLDSSKVRAFQVPNAQRGDLYLADIKHNGLQLSGRYLGVENFAESQPARDDFSYWSTDYVKSTSWAYYGIDKASHLTWSGKVLFETETPGDTLLIGSFINQVTEIDSNLFVCTHDGLHLLSRQNGSLKKEHKFFQGLVISRIIKDAEGVLWVSTVGKGCLKVTSLNSSNTEIPALDKLIQDYSNFGFNGRKLSVLNAEAVSQINTEDPSQTTSWKLIEPEGNAVYSHQLEDGTIAYFKNDKKNFKGLDFWGYFYVARKDQIIYRAGTYFRQKELKARQYYGVSGKSLDALYLTTSKGFVVAKGDSSIYDSFHRGFKERVNCIIGAGNPDILFVGTQDGLFEYNLRNSTWEILLEGEDITGLEYNEQYGLFAATKGAGLYRFKDGLWHNCLFGDHYIDNVVKDIHLWGSKIYVLTLNNLVLLDQSFTSEDDFTRVSSDLFGSTVLSQLIFSEDKPVLVDRHGLVAIDTNIFSYPFNNEFTIDQVIVNEEYLSLEDFRKKRLRHNDNNLSLRVRLKTLHNNAANRIRYRLAGLEEAWTETNDKAIQYLGLAPGDYKLQVAAESAIGQWSEPKSVLSIRIQEAFYKTWWFFASVAAVLTLIVWITYLLGTRVAERERQLLIANISSLKRQINPHFVLNALSSIRYYQRSNELEKADNYVTKLADLFSNIVYSSDNKRVLLSDELERLEKFVALEKVRFEGRLDFQLHIGTGLRPERLFIPPMLLQPLVENALEHGLKEVEAPRLSIDLNLKEQILEISVQDNGEGIDDALLTNIDTQKSVGLTNVIKRIDLIKQLEKKDLSIKLENDNGLKIVLRIEQ